MAADGTIKISTELDSSKAQTAMAKFSATAKSALKGVAVAASAAGAAITDRKSTRLNSSHQF